MPILVPVVVIAEEPSRQQQQLFTVKELTTATPIYRNPIVQKEVSDLTESIMKTIEDNEQVEVSAEDDGLEVGETMKKDDFDDVIPQEELRPIVKTILENGDRETDYIVEDIPSVVLFTTNTVAPLVVASTPRLGSSKIPDLPPAPPPSTPPQIVTTLLNMQSETPGSSTYNTLKTSPSDDAVTASLPLETTTILANQKLMVAATVTVTGSTTELNSNHKVSFAFEHVQRSMAVFCSDFFVLKSLKNQ